METPADAHAFQELMNTLASNAARSAAPATAASDADRARYVNDAVSRGRFGKDVIMNLFKGLMGEAMAGDFSESFINALFKDYELASPGERLLVENLGVLHAQLMMTRARWAGASDLEDIEALTRIQSRLTTEMTKVMAAIAEQRQSLRPIIQQANIAASQNIINQNVVAAVPNEQGGKCG